MTIHDTSPERRNLMVASLTFIAYFYAGGSFPDSNVRLQVINASFEKPEILALMAWIAFSWFLYRYWQTHTGQFSKEFREELSEWQGKKYISSYAYKRIDQDQVSSEDEGFHLNNMRWDRGSIILYFIHAKKVSRNSKGKITSYQDATNKINRDPIRMTDFWGWVLALRATIACMLKYPSFSNYVVPYLLAASAIVGAFVQF